MIATSIPVAEALRQIEAEKDRVLTEGAASTHPEIWTVNGGKAAGLETAAAIVRRIAAASTAASTSRSAEERAHAFLCRQYPGLSSVWTSDAHAALTEVIRAAEIAWKPIAEAKPGSGGLVLGNPDGVYVSGGMPDKWVRGLIREDGTTWDDEGYPLKASHFLVPPPLSASHALAVDSLMERPCDPSAFHEGEQFGQIVGVDQSHPDLRGVVDEGGVPGLHVEDRPTSSFGVGANVVLGHDGKVDRSQAADHGANEVAP